MGTVKHAATANVPGMLPICGADIWSHGVWAGMTIYPLQVTCPHCKTILARRSTVRFPAVKVDTLAPVSSRPPSSQPSPGSYRLIASRGVS